MVFQNVQDLEKSYLTLIKFTRKNIDLLKFNKISSGHENLFDRIIKTSQLNRKKLK